MQLHKTVLRTCFALSTFVLLLPSLAKSDDLDSVVDYLVQERETERANGLPQIAPEQSAQAPSGSTQFFRSSGDYRIDPVAKNSAGGVLESSTTYYPTAAGTSFSVRIVQAQPSKRKMDETYVSEVSSLALTFTQARKSHALTIGGLPAAYLDVQGNTVKSAIARIRKDTYLVVRAQDWLAVEAFGQFLQSLPFGAIETELTPERANPSSPV